MEDEGGRVLVPAGADRAGNGRGEGAAHAEIRHLLHQHQQREHERQSGQRGGAEAACEVRVDARGDGDQDDVDDEVRGGESQQGRGDRPLQ